MTVLIIAGWALTVVCWFLREVQHSRDQQEAMRMLKAESLTEFEVSKPSPPRRKHPGENNFFRRQIEKAYQNGVEDE